MENVSLFDFEPVKTTSRAKFFAEVEPHLPIADWVEIIRPIYYPDSYLGGRPPKPLEITLRTYLVQNFFSLSDEGTEDAVHDILSVRKFVGISVNESDIPDKSTICRFRNLLIEHNIQQKIFDHLVASLTAKGLIMKKGTIVDSTIIECSTSKRNKRSVPKPHSAIFSVFLPKCYSVRTPTYLWVCREPAPLHFGKNPRKSDESRFWNRSNIHKFMQL